MARLTNREQQILRHPPTEGTWVCTKTHGEFHCLRPNHGSSKACWLCRTKKPAKPKLLWPDYTKACAKAGIEPGTRWPPPGVAVEATPTRATRRKRG